MIRIFPAFRHFYWIGIAILLLNLTMSGCRKYPDGPTFSFQSKEARVTGNWVARTFFRNSLDELNRYDVYNLQFLREGRMVWRVQPAGGVLSEITGDWELANVNEAIKITFDLRDPVSNEVRLLYMDIRRLSGDELWVSFTDIDGDKFDVQFGAI